MTVYVDDMWRTKMGQYRGMKMSHMVADTLEELHEMAGKIGVQRKWFQEPPKVSHPHYDICFAMREKAVGFGAKEITMREMVVIVRGHKKAAVGYYARVKDFGDDWIYYKSFTEANEEAKAAGALLQTFSNGRWRDHETI